MLANEIRQWLATKSAPYQAGVELLKQVAPSHPVLSVLSLGDSSFTRSKLVQHLTAALEPIKESISVADTEAPATQQAKEATYQPQMYFTLPSNLQALEREKSTCFKSIISLRNQLKKELNFSLPHKIALADALRSMNTYDSLGNPIPFSISYVTADQEKQTGGEYKTYKGAFLSYQNKSGTRTYTGKEVERKVKKHTNHWVNGTRNIMVQGGNRLRCIHIWLILEFNGKEVIIGQPG